ncbi:hypothetical protein [Candidatus Poriferisocius sp.]|uniref:hypothetical protein n=1 Tax=Candidatus Poriferisocius sp. TaxID=3101276 RepID=UPI003B024230
MFFWFAALSFVLVALVFDSPVLDFRVVMLGSVLPVVELLVGGPWALHILLGPLVVLVVVMLVTHRRRLVRRRWLGLPIGLLMYLVLDGAWLRTELFWWPVLGVSVDSADLPEFRPLGVLVILELVGLAVGAWAVRRYGLTDRQRLRLLCTQGRLDRAQMGTTRRRR